MNDKIVIKINSNKIAETSVIDEDGTSKKIDGIVDVDKLEYENAIEVLNNKKIKLIEMINNIDSKSQNIDRIFIRYRIPLYIICFMSLFTHGMDIIHYISGALLLIVFGAATVAKSYDKKMENKRNNLLGIKNYIDKDIRELEKKLAKEKDTLNVLNLQISNRVINDIEENYSLWFGPNYDDIEYEYAKMSKKKEKENRPASYDLEYINYDEVPKRKSFKK